MDLILCVALCAESVRMRVQLQSNLMAHQHSHPSLSTAHNHTESAVSTPDSLQGTAAEGQSTAQAGWQAHHWSEELVSQRWMNSTCINAMTLSGWGGQIFAG